MKVTATLKAEGQEPTIQKWCSNATELDVMESVAQLLKADKDESPWSPRVLDIRIEL